MRMAFVLAIFAGVFATVYFASFVNGWTLFRYYPLTGEFTTEDLPRSAGPAMGWYAWIVQGFAVAVLAALLALVLPGKLTNRVWSGLGWLLPVLVVLYTFYYEWHWFQG
jgi:hypothetical protein